ncbi:HrpF/NolX family T3SS translocon protein [Ralstonia pseudosolanacearum]|uniref:HrpF/NolX family T3SS translocon protein n=4 Tax=Ralstonia pseudosolanacearum TaxID=1310165 RepID=UPI00399D5D3A
MRRHSPNSCEKTPRSQAPPRGSPWNRNEWASLNKMDDPDKRVGKADFLQRAASAVHLSKEDLQTVSTINSNLDVFFKDGQKITRDRLAAMSQDESLSPAVRNAAKQLLQDPLLYGLINNANSGYKTKNGFFSFGGPTVDSGVIGKKDFEKFMSSMTDANKTVQARKTHPANSEASKSAVADMGMGMEDQPDIKAVKKSGGALKKAMDKTLTIPLRLADGALRERAASVSVAPKPGFRAGRRNQARRDRKPA